MPAHSEVTVGARDLDQQVAMQMGMPDGRFVYFQQRRAAERALGKTSASRHGITRSRIQSNDLAREHLPNRLVFFGIRLCPERCVLIMRPIDQGSKQMAETIFSKIITGEIPCAKVYEDEHTFAFMDAGQVIPDHVPYPRRRSSTSMSIWRQPCSAPSPKSRKRCRPPLNRKA